MVSLVGAARSRRSAPELRAEARSAAPWYVHPAEDPAAWQRLVGGSELAFAVVNADNGPGPAADPYYGPALAGGSRTPLVGYVDVAYGSRPRPQIMADVQTWADRYGVTSVMLDCVPAELTAGHWSLGLVDELRAAGVQQVVANPGRPPAPELLSAVDVTCVAEYAWDFYRTWQPPHWLSDYDPARIWHLIHDVPVSEQQQARELAGRRGAGFVWPTAGRLPNPWSTLPGTW